MGFEPTTLRDLVRCSYHWPTGVRCSYHWATGDSMVSKGQFMGLNWNPITRLHSQVMTGTHELTNIDSITTINYDYYSFKIFSCFWLVKTTRIIHHNQLLFTKFGKNLRHIESMTSKVRSTKNYWTDDIKMKSKVQPAADYWTIDRENLGTRLCYIWWAEKQRA